MCQFLYTCVLSRNRCKYAHHTNEGEYSKFIVIITLTYLLMTLAYSFYLNRVLENRIISFMLQDYYKQV